MGMTVGRQEVIQVKKQNQFWKVSLDLKVWFSRANPRRGGMVGTGNIDDRAKRELKKTESEKRKAQLMNPRPRGRNSEKDLVVKI
jgi:hypothetical protein